MAATWESYSARCRSPLASRAGQYCSVRGGTSRPTTGEYAAAIGALYSTGSTSGAALLQRLTREMAYPTPLQPVTSNAAQTSPPELVLPPDHIPLPPEVPVWQLARVRPAPEQRLGQPSWKQELRNLERYLQPLLIADDQGAKAQLAALQTRATPVLTQLQQQAVSMRRSTTGSRPVQPKPNTCCIKRRYKRWSSNGNPRCSPNMNNDSPTVIPLQPQTQQMLPWPI